MGAGKFHFPFSADHEQDWQPYPVDQYSAIYDTRCSVSTAQLRTAVVVPNTRLISFLLFYTFFFFLVSLIADEPHHYHPACGHRGSSHLSPLHALQFFIAMQVQHSYNLSTNG